MEKIKYLLAMMTLFGTFLLILVVVFWLAYPYRTIAFANSPFPVEPEIYRANDYLKIHVEYERYTDVPSIAVVRFTDGITFTMLPMTFQKPKGSGKELSMSIRVPPTLPPGKYYLDICFSYRVNPIREIVVVAQTQQFEVQ